MTFEESWENDFEADGLLFLCLLEFLSDCFLVGLPYGFADTVGELRERSSETCLVDGVDGLVMVGLLGKTSLSVQEGSEKDKEAIPIPAKKDKGRYRNFDVRDSMSFNISKSNKSGMDINVNIITSSKFKFDMIYHLYRESFKTTSEN